jgi:hypothetical protein
MGYLCLRPITANRDPLSWTRTQSALFLTFQRPIFLISLSTLIYLMMLDYGKFMKTILSRHFWTFLAKLSYGVYLLFPLVAGHFNSSMGSPLYLTYIEMIY